MGSISETQQATSKEAYKMSTPKSDVPLPPQNTAVGGKASRQPKRTPVTDKEIEAVLVSIKQYFSTYELLTQL